MADNPAARTGDRSAVAIADQQARCLELRRDGKSIREIAAETGIPRSTVGERIHDAIAEIVLPLADDVRQLELARLDRWQTKLEDALDNGDDPVKVVPVLVRVSESRRKLEGTDAPERVEATVHALTPDPDTEAVLADARARAQARIAEVRGE